MTTKHLMVRPERITKVESMLAELTKEVEGLLKSLHVEVRALLSESTVVNHKGYEQSDECKRERAAARARKSRLNREQYKKPGADE